MSCAGRSALVAIALAACGSDPDVHLDVTRMTNQKVTLQLCDPADRAIPCKTSELFQAPDPIDATKTIELFVDDTTPTLILQFTLAAPNFCTQVELALGEQIDARVALPADELSLADIEGCESCVAEVCE